METNHPLNKFKEVYKNIRVYGTNEDTLFVAIDIGKELKIKKIAYYIKHFSKNEKSVMKIKDTLNRLQHMYVLNMKGISKLLSNIRKEKAYEMGKILNININQNKVEPIETSIYVKIIKTFNHLKIIPQYKVGKYNINFL